jgi:hypothetical protein
MIRLTCPELEDHFLRLIKKNEGERLSVKAYTIEAQVLQAIYERGDKVENGKLSIKEITEKLNEDKPEREKKNVKQIGWKIKALALPPAKMNNGNRGIEYISEQIESLMKKYGLLIDDSKIEITNTSAEKIDLNSENNPDERISVETVSKIDQEILLLLHNKFIGSFIVDGYLLLDNIMFNFNFSSPEEEKINIDQLSERLEKIGLSVIIQTDGSRYIKYDLGFIESLILKLGLDLNADAY